MKPSHLALLLLALLAVPPRAHAQPTSAPCPDGTYACIGERNQALWKGSLQRLREACLPQLEEASRAFLKSQLPDTELASLSLSENGGALTNDQPIDAYMEAECANKARCDTATLALTLPPEKAPERCKPTELRILVLKWNGAALWQDLQKDNPQVKLHAGTARRFGIKAKRLRLQALLAKLRTNKAFTVEENTPVGCSIRRDVTKTTCFAVGLISKETEDLEHNLTFGIQKKEGHWELLPDSLSFQ